MGIWRWDGGWGALCRVRRSPSGGWSEGPHMQREQRGWGRKWRKYENRDYGLRPFRWKPILTAWRGTGG